VESTEEDGAQLTRQNGRTSLADISPRLSPKPVRKRKRKSLADELEEAHIRKMAEEYSEDSPPTKKRKETDEEDKEAGDSSGWSTGHSSSEDRSAVSGSDDEEELESEEDDDGDIPVHESLAQGPNDAEVDQANRTVFLGNVSNDAISSKSAKKTLLAHMSQVLDRDATPNPEKIESIRFRSVAFSTLGPPKRAAFITKSLMDATTKSTNAYLVYSTATAARRAVTELNGTIVLGRHVRVDGVAHPTKVDHRRCVFVGNLGYVDDVSNVQAAQDDAEESSKKKKQKPPADVEEGLWRVFGKEAGRVENVRVVRDPKTRVGKGFAYVQFYVSRNPCSRWGSWWLTASFHYRMPTMSRPRCCWTRRSSRPCSRASSVLHVPRIRRRRPWLSKSGGPARLLAPRSASVRKPLRIPARNIIQRPHPKKSPWPAEPPSFSAWRPPQDKCMVGTGGPATESPPPLTRGRTTRPAPGR
jgi:RNA recognition motif-containing protein